MKPDTNLLSTSVTREMLQHHGGANAVLLVVGLSDTQAHPILSAGRYCLQASYSAKAD